MEQLTRDPRGNPAPDRLNYTAARFARALNRAAENTALAHGITLPELLILQVLGEGLPLSNAQVARRTFVSSQAAHVVSEELLELGLVEKLAHPTNRRVRLVALTEEGWSTLERCTHDLRAREERLFEAMGAGTGILARDLQRAAEVLAGGYFGDAEAEAAAVAARRRRVKPQAAAVR